MVKICQQIMTDWLAHKIKYRFILELSVMQYKILAVIIIFEVHKNSHADLDPFLC